MIFLILVCPIHQCCGVMPIIIWKVLEVGIETLDRVKGKISSNLAQLGWDLMG